MRLSSARGRRGFRRLAVHHPECRSRNLASLASSFASSCRSVNNKDVGSELNFVYKTTPYPSPESLAGPCCVCLDVSP